MVFKYDYENVDTRFEHLLFLKLFIDPDFRGTVMPILKQEYFNEPCGEYPYDIIFKHFSNFYNKGQIDISPIQVLNAIEEERYIEPEDFKKIKRIFKKIFTLNDEDEFIYDVDVEYLTSTTEKFAQELAIELALMESANILENEPEEKGKIRDLLDEALSIELNKDIGLNYLDSAFERFTFYQKREDKIPFSMECLNNMTYGGFARKTLNVFMAGTGIGKTLLMTSLTTDYIQRGYNVLYVTLEISEELIRM